MADNFFLDSTIRVTKITGIKELLNQINNQEITLSAKINPRTLQANIKSAISNATFQTNIVPSRNIIGNIRTAISSATFPINVTINRGAFQNNLRNALAGQRFNIELGVLAGPSRARIREFLQTVAGRVRLDVDTRSLARNTRNALRDEIFNIKVRGVITNRAEIARSLTGATRELAPSIANVATALPNLSPLSSQVSGITDQFTKLRSSVPNEAIEQLLRTGGSAGDRIAGALGLATSSAESFGISIGVVLRRFSAFAVASKALITFQNIIRNSIKTAIDFEQGLADLAKVDRLVALNTDFFAQKQLDLARAFSVTIEQVQQIQLEFARQGRTTQETADLTASALLAINAAGVTSSDAIELLTIALNVFNVTASESSTIIDKLSALADANAVNVNDLIGGFKRAASSFDTANVSIEEAASLLSILRENTLLSAEVIGTSIKTIIPSVVAAQESIEQLGVSTRNSLGEFDFTETLRGLNRLFQTLNTEQRFNLVVDIVGKRQADRFIALINNINDLERDLAIQAAATGTAFIKQSIQLETFNSRLNKLRTTFFDVANALGDTGLFNFGKIALTSITTALDGFSRLIKGVNELNIPLGSVAATFIGFKFVIPTIFGIINGVRDFVNLLSEARKIQVQNAEALQQIVSANNGVIAGMREKIALEQQFRSEVQRTQAVQQSGGAADFLALTARGTINRDSLGRTSEPSRVTSVNLPAKDIAATSSKIQNIAITLASLMPIVTGNLSSQNELIKSFATNFQTATFGAVAFSSIIKGLNFTTALAGLSAILATVETIKSAGQIEETGFEKSFQNTLSTLDKNLKAISNISSDLKEIANTAETDLETRLRLVTDLVSKNREFAGLEEQLLRLNSDNVNEFEKTVGLNDRILANLVEQRNEIAKINKLSGALSEARTTRAREAINKQVSAGIGAAVGAIGGGVLGTFIGPTGTLLGVKIGTAVGTVAGSFIGASLGKAISGFFSEDIDIDLSSTEGTFRRIITLQEKLRSLADSEVEARDNITKEIQELNAQYVKELQLNQSILALSLQQVTTDKARQRIQKDFIVNQLDAKEALGDNAEVLLEQLGLLDLLTDQDRERINNAKAIASETRKSFSENSEALQAFNRQQRVAAKDVLNTFTEINKTVRATTTFNTLLNSIKAIRAEAENIRFNFEVEKIQRDVRNIFNEIDNIPQDIKVLITIEQDRQELVKQSNAIENEVKQLRERITEAFPIFNQDDRDRLTSIFRDIDTGNFTKALADIEDLSLGNVENAKKLEDEIIKIINSEKERIKVNEEINKNIAQQKIAIKDLSDTIAKDLSDVAFSGFDFTPQQKLLLDIESTNNRIFNISKKISSNDVAITQSIGKRLDLLQKLLVVNTDIAGVTENIELANSFEEQFKSIVEAGSNGFNQLSARGRAAFADIFQSASLEDFIRDSGRFIEQARQLSIANIVEDDPNSIKQQVKDRQEFNNITRELVNLEKNISSNRKSILDGLQAEKDTVKEKLDIQNILANIDDQQNNIREATITNLARELEIFKEILALNKEIVATEVNRFKTIESARVQRDRDLTNSQAEFIKNQSRLNTLLSGRREDTAGLDVQTANLEVSTTKSLIDQVANAVISANTRLGQATDDRIQAEKEAIDIAKRIGAASGADEITRLEAERAAVLSKIAEARKNESLEGNKIILLLQQKLDLERELEQKSLEGTRKRLDAELNFIEQVQAANRAALDFLSDPSRSAQAIEDIAFLGQFINDGIADFSSIVGDPESIRRITGALDELQKLGAVAIEGVDVNEFRRDLESAAGDLGRKIFENRELDVEFGAVRADGTIRGFDELSNAIENARKFIDEIKNQNDKIANSNLAAAQGQLESQRAIQETFNKLIDLQNQADENIRNIIDAQTTAVEKITENLSKPVQDLIEAMESGRLGERIAEIFVEKLQAENAAIKIDETSLDRLEESLAAIPADGIDLRIVDQSGAEVNVTFDQNLISAIRDAIIAGNESRLLGVVKKVLNEEIPATGG